MSCLHLRCPLSPADVQLLCERMLGLTGPTVLCRVHDPVDLSAVDALARLSLLAQHIDVQLEVRADSQDLGALLDLTGLATAVPGRRKAGRKPRW